MSVTSAEYLTTPLSIIATASWHRDYERHLPGRGLVLHSARNVLKGAGSGGGADARGLALPELDCRDRPFSIMTFDRNPKPVQFIEPNILHRTRLSVGKDDGFADQFGLRLTVVAQDL